MRIANIRRLFVPCLLVLLAAAVCQAVPAQISFQGSIADAVGPVNDTLTMTFRLFDAETGGPPLWEEAQESDKHRPLCNGA